MTVQSRSSRNRVFIGALSTLATTFLGCSGRVDLAGERQKTDQDGGTASVGGGAGSGGGEQGSGGEATAGSGGSGPYQATGGSVGYPYGGSGAVGEAGGSSGYPYGGSGVGAAGGGYGYGGVGAGAGGSGPYQATGGSFSSGGTASVSVTCDLSCVTRDLRAEADSPLLPIPPGDEATICFGYHVDNGAYTTATAFAPLIDEAVAVRDMSLLKMSTPQTNGASFQCGSSPLSGAPVWSWVPGVGPTTASLGLDPGDFVLAVHYVNVSPAPVTDTSGVRICACPQ